MCLHISCLIQLQPPLVNLILEAGKKWPDKRLCVQGTSESQSHDPTSFGTCSLLDIQEMAC